MKGRIIHPLGEEAVHMLYLSQATRERMKEDFDLGTCSNCRVFGPDRVSPTGKSVAEQR